MYKLNTLQKKFLHAGYSVSRYPPDPLVAFFPPQEMQEALGVLKTIHDSFSPKWKGKQHKSSEEHLSGGYPVPGSAPWSKNFHPSEGFNMLRR